MSKSNDSSKLGRTTLEELTEAELSAISGGIALSPQGPGSEGFYHVGIWFDAA